MSTITINTLSEAIAFLQSNDDNVAYTLAEEFFQLKIKLLLRLLLLEFRFMLGKV